MAKLPFLDLFRSWASACLLFTSDARGAPGGTRGIRSGGCATRWPRRQSQMHIRRTPVLALLGFIFPARPQIGPWSLHCGLLGNSQAQLLATPPSGSMPATAQRAHGGCSLCKGGQNARWSQTSPFFPRTGFCTEGISQMMTLSPYSLHRHCHKEITATGVGISRLL